MFRTWSNRPNAAAVTMVSTLAPRRASRGGLDIAEMEGRQQRPFVVSDAVHRRPAIEQDFRDGGLESGACRMRVRYEQVQGRFERVRAVRAGDGVDLRAGVEQQARHSTAFFGVFCRESSTPFAAT
ncbi:MAG: hypothetical protein ABJF01_25290 [bacterium]